MRKFLEMEDEVLAIYDEIREQAGSKRENRFNDDPVKIHKKENNGSGIYIYIKPHMPFESSRN